jgi:DnaJ-class molecular chaperone
MDGKDYYKVLDVTENATPDELKKSYRNLAFRYHPDRNPGSQEQMKEINEAYAVLSNPEKKREYDALRRSFGSGARDRFRQTYTDQDIFRNSDINQIFEELSRVFGFSRPEDIFSRDAFYGRTYREFQFRGPGVFGKGVFFGFPGAPHPDAPPAGKKTLSQKLLMKSLTLFRRMAAKKLGIVLPEQGEDRNATLTVTKEQASAGAKVKFTVYRAGTPREILITVPAGIREGQTIKLKGLGEPGRNGGEAGDLYLAVRLHRTLSERFRKFLEN